MDDWLRTLGERGGRERERSQTHRTRKADVTESKYFEDTDAMREEQNGESSSGMRAGANLWTFKFLPKLGYFMPSCPDNGVTVYDQSHMERCP